MLTFGYNPANTPSSNFVLSASYGHGTAPTPYPANGDETVTLLTAYCGDGSGSMALYTSVGGNPNTRVGASAVIQGVTGTSDWRSTLALNIPLAAATSYVPAAGILSALRLWMDVGSAGNSSVNTNNTLPVTWTRTGGGNNIWALYATYEVAGGGVDITVPTHAFTLSTFAPTVGSGASVDVPTEALTLTPVAPAVAAGAAVTVPTASLTLTPVAPAVAGGAAVTVPTHVYTRATFAPAVAGGASVQPPAAALTLTPHAPAVTDGVNVQVPTAALTLTAYVPVVTTAPGSGVNIIVPTKAIALATLAPQVAGGASAALPVHTFALAPIAPTVAGGASVQPPAVNYPLAVLVPTVITGASVSPPTHAYTLAPQAPVLTSGVNVQLPTHAFTLRLLPPLVNEDDLHYFWWMPPRLYGFRPREVECTILEPQDWHDLLLTEALQAVDDYRPELEADVQRRLAEV